VSISATQDSLLSQIVPAPISAKASNKTVRARHQIIRSVIGAVLLAWGRAWHCSDTGTD
jgi:hypothetical protein